jgi:hypothetical protein
LSGYHWEIIEGKLGQAADWYTGTLFFRHEKMLVRDRWEGWGTWDMQVTMSPELYNAVFLLIAPCFVFFTNFSIILAYCGAVFNLYKKPNPGSATLPIN